MSTSMDIEGSQAVGAGPVSSKVEPDVKQQGPNVMTISNVFEFSSYAQSRSAAQVSSPTLGQPGCLPIRGMISIKASPLPDMSVMNKAALKVCTVWVVDVSASMQTANRLPLARDSLMVALSKTPVGNGFCVIEFDDSAHILVPVTVQDVKFKASTDANHQVEKLVTKNSTNLCGAIVMALDQVHTKIPADVIPHIVLMTDGEPTVGVMDPKSIVETVCKHPAWNRVALSAIGFGSSPNWNLLNLVSDASGGGAIYMVDDASKIPEVVGSIFGLLSTITASDIKVDIVTPLNNMTWTHVSGARQNPKGRTHHQLRWSQMSAEQERHVVFEMKIPSNMAQQQSDLPVVITLRYRNSMTGKWDQSSLTVQPSFDAQVACQPSTDFQLQIYRLEAAAAVAARNQAKLESLQAGICRLPQNLRTRPVMQRCSADIAAAITGIASHDDQAQARCTSHARNMACSSGMTSSGLDNDTSSSGQTRAIFRAATSGMASSSAGGSGSGGGGAASALTATVFRGGVAQTPHQSRRSLVWSPALNTIQSVTDLPNRPATGNGGPLAGASAGASAGPSVDPSATAGLPGFMNYLAASFKSNR